MLCVIDEIRTKIAAGLFEFSKHATEKHFAAHCVQELREAIDSGEIIEDYPNDKYGSRLFDFRLDDNQQTFARSVQLSVAPAAESHHAL
jgi:hypothetical protein